MDSHINVDVSAVRGSTAENTDVGIVDFGKEIPEKQQPRCQKGQIEQHIVYIDHPYREMNVGVITEKGKYMFIFCFFVGHSSPLDI